MSDDAEVSAGSDLSALAWVQGELRRTLETAHKSLRRYFKEAEAVGQSDVDAADTAALRVARTQLHQGVGALELVGLPAAAQALRGSEAAVQRMANKPALVTAAAIEAIEKLSFGVLDLLARQLAGKPVSPVMLFPQYRAAQELAGADRIHPADLWTFEFDWRALPRDDRVAARAADDAARSDMEGLVLQLMRQPAPATLMQMSDLCAGLAAGALGDVAASSHPATFWQLAAAVFEAQAAGLLASDVYTKRIASRLLALLRAAVRGGFELSDRLAQDLLFFCSHARAPEATRAAPRLAAVRQTWQLAAQPTADYETARLGRFDPAVVALARKRVAGAKDAWSAVAGGELHRLAGLADQFALVGDSLQRLFPQGDVLAQALQTTVAQTVAAAAEPPPPLAMEVATGVLYVDACLEDGEFDHPDLAERVEHLARRIDEVRGGAEPHPLDIWMEELYRRVSDRQTMGSVVQELRASLSEVEKQIDQYFRDPTRRELLIPVPGQLASMRGVLSVLGMSQASQAVLRMRDDVDALAQTEVDPQRAIQTGTFDRLADNLGALSFLIDMLSVQPQLAKSLFHFDPASGSLSAVMGQSERVSAFAAFDEAPSSDPSEPVPPAPASTTSLPPEPLPLPLSAPVPPPRAAAPGDTGLEDDAEMREIFIEEAREVVADARESLLRLADQPDNAAEMTGLRRAFHTLKGSSRMIGLRDFGDAAWACEQLFNARLAEDARVEPPLRAFSTEALDYLAAWTEAIAAGRDDGHRSPAVVQAADALRLHHQRLPLQAATPPVASAPAASAPAFDPSAAAPPATDPPAVDALGADAPAIFDPLPLSDDWLPLPELTVATLTMPSGELPPDVLLEILPDLADDAPTITLERELPDGVDIALPEVPGLPSVDTVAAPADVGAPRSDTPVDFEFLFEPDPDAAAPALAAASSPMVVEGIKGEFATPAETAESAATADTEVARAAPLAGLAELIARVPGLPSAADLDLGLPEPQIPLPVPDAQPSTLEIDLGAFDDDGAQSLPLPETVEPEELPLDALATWADLPAADLPLADLPLADPPPADPPPADPPSTPPDAAIEVLELDLADLETEFAAPAASAPPLADAEPLVVMEDEDQVKVIGPLRISIPLFNIFLNEADELSRRMCIELAEWAHEHEHQPVGDSSVALAHSLAGNSATVGYTELSALARALEHALMRSHAFGHGRADEPALFSDVADEIRRLLHQFAAGFLRPVPPELMERLAEHERLPMPPVVDAEADADADAAGLPSALADVGNTEAIAVPPVDRPTSEPEPEPEPEPEIDAAQPEATAPAPLAPLFTPSFVALADLPAAPTPLHPGPHARADAFDDDEDIDAVDTIDPELFPIFEEEAEELLPQLQQRLREWLARPADGGAADACMRTLHTFKGGARLAGAMRLGEMAHRLETAIEHRLAQDALRADEIEPLLGRADGMALAFERLRRPAQQPQAAPAAADVPAAMPPSTIDAPVSADATPTQAAPSAAAIATTASLVSPSITPSIQPVTASQPIDWARFVGGDGEAAAPTPDRPAAGGAAVRVRAGLLDRMVNQAGEVSITRARIDADVKQLQGALNDLTDSLERLRRQLRDIELQAETQINTRMEAAKAAAQAFDPLEMDRFTRFQELTRFMAESVNDVATLQRSLQRTLQSTEDELAAQARLTRELQDDLLRTRMVEFESLADRLYRTVRQAAKDAGKQVRLDIVGGAIEVDRGVLERMIGPFEHLLRNSVAHGIEAPDRRIATGKTADGAIVVTVAQAGNEVAVEFGDDGGGLDLARIRQRGIERALLAADQPASDADLAQLIFAPGFSTAETVTELAGRGIGLDVVRAEVNAMGGRIETASTPGQGTRFRLLLPLTTAVTQVVLLRCGELTVAVPSTLIQVVRRVPAAEVESAYASGNFDLSGESMPFFWLAALMQAGHRGETATRPQTVVVIRSAAQRVALHVDEVVGNQEVVVKNVGPQLARLPGLVGVTLLPSGAASLIYNPVALATLYADAARRMMRQTPVDVVVAEGANPEPAAPAKAPLVLVVDDSLTVRRVTQRLLVREGYRVTLAKDGLEALERLADERPVVLLSDIEMPRMDGFDLLRNVRAEARLAGLPVVMITSRTAQKHRDYATALGADHYLGKPYSEETLLGLVAQYAQAAAALATAG